MIIDRPMLGISLMLGFCVLAPLGDAIAKLLGDTVALGMLLVVRFGVQAVLLAPLVAMAPHRLRMSRRVFRLTLIRGALHVVGIGAMFLSLRFLPLADAVAIAFVMPFIMLILGKTVLGELVGLHRLAACGVGFAGTLLVIQPNFASVGAPALLPLLVAIVFALFMLVTRAVAKQVDPLPLQFVSGIVSFVLLVPVLLLVPRDWGFSEFSVPAGRDIGLLLVLGTIGTGAHLLMTWSLRYAPSATLAPMQYLEIPVATFVGWLIFRDLPNGLAALGIVVTVAAGLYVIWRERFIARQGLPQPRPVPQAAK